MKFSGKRIKNHFILMKKGEKFQIIDICQRKLIRKNFNDLFWNRKNIFFIKKTIIYSKRPLKLLSYYKKILLKRQILKKLK